MSLAISAVGLTRRFGELLAVDGLDLEIEVGSIHGFLGPNGCGKSTAIRLLCGLLLPSAGSATVLGVDVRRHAERLRTRIGYMTQRFSFYEDLSVRENLVFMWRIHGLASARRVERIDAALARFDLIAQADQLAGTLSGGQRQRLALAGVTLHGPELLLLDEPTSAVDPESRRRFWETLFEFASQGTTILVSSHFMDEAERCHALTIMNAGRRVAHGEPALLMDQLPATVIEVRSADAHGCGRLLTTVPGVLEVTQLGTRLHVLVDATLPAPLPRLEAALKGAGMAAQTAIVRASLEDVFVMATRASGAVADDADAVARPAPSPTQSSNQSSAQRSTT